jgi:GntR family transcriptional regulator/MocR family aminotransferase
MLRPWQLEIQLDKKSNTALYLQIADAIIYAIKSGKLSSGNALPGSRQLASLLLVNRNTVIEALDVLITEGWLITIDRKGTFVADILPEILLNNKHKEPKIVADNEVKPHLVFDDGLPDSRLAPMTDLARAYREIWICKQKVEKKLSYIFVIS